MARCGNCERCSEFAISASRGEMQSISILCDTEAKLKIVKTYVGQPGFDFLRITKSHQIPVHVLVTADRLIDFKNDLHANHIHYNVTVEDVSKAFQNQDKKLKRERVRRAPRTGINLERFATYSEITSYVNFLATNYRDFVEAFSIGKSYKKKHIMGVKISTGGNEKPALLIEAGIHSREWISISTALYVMKELIENPTNRQIFAEIDIYIIPCLNPDGYEYTFKSINKRLWRKTRSKNRFSFCKGTDANRNFDVQWGHGESSNDPCSEIFIGKEPFSEKETKAFRDFVHPLQNKITTYLSLHSYAGLILYPWSFIGQPPANIQTLKCIARRVQSAISRIAGVPYQIGNSYDLLYSTAGDSMDWVVYSTNINLAFTIEIHGGDYGFIPRVEHIIPTGREIFEGIKVFALAVNGRICNFERTDHTGSSRS